LDAVATYAMSELVHRIASTRFRKIWKWFAVSAASLALLYVGAYGFFAYQMRQTLDQFSMIMARVGPIPFLLFPFESMWLKARAGTLQPGDPAPDFELPRLDHSGVVRLSALRGAKPVVLIFGSYT
jgi:hypothetical protein